MEVYIYLNHEDTFFGIFKTDTKLLELPRRGGPQVAELFTSTGISYRSEQQLYLYRITLDRSYYWIRATDHAAALVDAILFRRSQGLPEAGKWRVLEYDLADEDYGNEVEIYPIDIELSPLCEKLFKILTKENRDLVAHAIANLEQLETEEELWEMEVSRNTPARKRRDEPEREPYLGVDKIPEEEMARLSRNHFVSMCLIDCASASPEALALLRSCYEMADRERLMLWWMVFERWGERDCRFPHFLYRGLLDGYFDATLPEYIEKRGALV